MTGFLRDVKFALRTLAKSPTFALVAVLTLGLGIGAVTAIFSVVNAVVLKPLPFPRSDRLMRLYTQFPGQKLDRFWLSPPEFFDLRREARSFQSLAGYVVAGAALSTKDRPVRGPAAYTTASLAATLGVSPQIGRWFTPEEDLPGDAQAVVISHRLWQRGFAGDEEIVGRRVTLDGAPATVVGVMPDSFAFPNADTDLWIPLGLDPTSQQRGSHFITVVGRLADGVSLGGAQAEAIRLMAAWGASGMQHPLAPPGHPMGMETMKEWIVGPVGTTLWLLQAAVLLVLLIACANVSNLLLVRAEARSREIAIRNALGANRMRLVRQFLTESLILGLLGAALGLLLANWGVAATVALLPVGAPRATEIHVDLWVLGFGVACALGTSLLFGLAPIVHTHVADLGAALKEGQRTAGSPQQRFRRALVVSEVALAVVLVIGCGLVVKSFVRLRRVDTGFRPAGLTTAQVEILDKSYPGHSEVMGFWDRVAGELRAQPGVKSVSYMTGLPPNRRLNANDSLFEGIPQPPEGPVHNIDFWQTVGDDYFETMGMRLVAGRWLRPGDTADSAPVVVVNEALARKFYPGQDPIGKRLKAAPGRRDANRPWQTIVGVVADVKQQGLEAPTGTEVFMALRQFPVILGDKNAAPRLMNLVVRSDLPTKSVAGLIRGVVGRADASVPVFQLRGMDSVMFEAVGKPRFITFLLAIFAGLALLLAAVGIYGVMSYSVAQRTRELGIRMALGAQAGGVRRLVMAEGLLLAALGVAVGLGAALALNTGLATRMAAILYQVHAVDPATFAGVAAVVLLVAGLACFIPARRATRVDPMVALRHE